MEKQYKVGIVGATGMVGQRFVTLLENHPWFKLTVLAASGRSAGKTYEEAVGPRWAMTSPMPESVKKMVVLDASKVEEVASQVDFIFCAVNMPKDEIKALEEAYAKAECPVVSNNSANRFTPDVPMVVPEINADHIEIIPAQRKRLGTKRGFIAVKSNCSLQSYVPALHPLMKDFGVSKALVCTYQAISGAGKTFDRMPEIVDNVIPYIGGEEEKSEREPLKLWGHIEGDHIVNAEKPVITAQCFRVPVSDGHTAAVFVSFEKKPTKEQILEAWANFRGPAQELDLPSAPKQFLHYFTEPDRPQPKLDRNTENGMAVCIGRLREDTLFDYKFACMSHNTLRTPMYEDGSINFDELGRIIEDQIAHHTDAIIICGTTGECSTMTDEEQLAAIKYTVEVVNHRVPVIAGAGSNDTDHGCALAAKSAECGADALLMVTPYYNKTTQAGLVAHFTAMAEAGGIPVIMYNVPSRTGLNIAPETALELSKHPLINGIKEASGNISQVAKIAQLCGDELNIYSGNDDQVVPLLALGGKGVISVVSNVKPELVHNCCKAFFDGDTAKARELQLEMLPLADALFCEVNPIPVKYAMNVLGWEAGECRLPLVEPSEAHKEYIEKALRAEGLITE